MSNMSYCRYHNTLLDLQDCYYALQDEFPADPDHPWLAENPGPCQGCDGPGAIWYRTNSAYVDERQNWSWLCPQCQDRSDADYAEMWDEYWRERL